MGERLPRERGWPPMRTDITPRQTSDYLGFDLVMHNNLSEPFALFAGQGYYADKIRKTMRERNTLPVIPMRKTRNMRVDITSILLWLCYLLT